MKKSIILLGVILISLEIARGTVIYIPGDYPTIQAGIDAAEYGDTVLVANGTYIGDGNRDIDFKGKEITVKSENGASNCIIDCQGTEAEPHRGFYFHSGETPNAYLKGFTIQNGYSDRSDGGGIHCYGSSPTILNNIITNNTGFGEGGGIYCDNSSLIIINNIITGNFARFSGGGGIFCYNSSPTILNNIIADNSCHAHNWGGGIYCDSSLPTIMNNVIMRNKAGKGGGIYCNSSLLTITNNSISDNSVGLHAGGGIYCKSSSIVILNTILWGNPPESICFDDKGDYNTVTISYTDIQGGQAGIVTNDNGTVNWGDGNINTAPLFIEPIHGNYRLSDYSPCIGAGTDNGAPETDIEGNPRGTPPDIGAYENSLDTPLTRPPITIHVSVNGSDETGDGSKENPYRTIQKGIYVAINGDTVLVADGTYTGDRNRNLDFCGKALTVRSENVAENCIIDCENEGNGFHFHSGETSDACVDGFTIQKANVFGGILCEASSPNIINNKFSNNTRGISCYDNSSPIITNNAIFLNSEYGILCSYSSSIVKNSTITKNNRFGVYVIGDSLSTVLNTILWENSEGGISGEANVTYSDIQGGYTGEGNINVNPLFVDPGSSDYHLSDYSPCIGAGTSYNAPETDIEGNPRGTPPDMGAFENPLDTPLIRPPITIHISVNGSDETGDGSKENPFRTIQKGIDVAVNGDTVLVTNGVYTGDGNRDLDFKSKKIIVKSENGASNCIIDCQGTEAEPHRGFYFHSGETSDACVHGFTIRNGYIIGHGGGIYCDGASPTIINNVITNNTAYSFTITPSSGGGGLYCFNSSAIIMNNLIINNYVRGLGGGICCESAIIINNTIAGNYSQAASFEDCIGGISCHSSSVIVNTIVWENSGSHSVRQISEGANVTFSDVQDGYEGEGNINADPLFVDPENSDFHLTANSPCIDTGDPDSPLDPDSTRADMGAFYFDQSDFVLTSPNGDEIWPVGSSQEILWIPICSVDSVKLEYSIDSGLTWITITDNILNEGAYVWIIPNAPSIDCLVRISDTFDGTPFDVSDSTFVIGSNGDINGDGVVDIFDLVKLINFILGKMTPAPYEFWAADINDDGVLDIFDVVKMINIILEGEPTTLAKMSVSPAQNGGLSLPDVALIPEQVTEVPIYATFDGTVAGVQLELRYDPQTLKVSAPVLTSRADQMDLASVNKDGKLTVLIYSASGNVIEAGSDPILNLRVETLSGFNGANRLEVANAIVVNGKAEAVSISFSTGNIAAAKPPSYSLSQNYPNPFNSQTMISYQLPKSDRVLLNIYNTMGQEIRTLVDKVQEAGYYNINWDGKNDEGMRISSGIYICRIQTQDFVKVLKMLFVM